MESGKDAGNPVTMSQKTYKNAVAKQRKLKRLRKMKTKDRESDIQMSDISDIECTQPVNEESQDAWLNDLITTDKPDDNSSKSDLCNQVESFTDKLYNFSMSNKEVVGIGIGALLFFAFFKARS